MDVNVFDEKSLDFLETNYYKLPFCDEDVKEFNELPGNWDNRSLEDDFELQYHHGLASPLSPSYSLSPSSSSGSSSGQNATEHAHSLLNERPDTPLMAVKFEDFSNDYGLDDLNYPIFASENDPMNDEQLDIDNTLIPDDLHKYVCASPKPLEDQVVFDTKPDQPIDCSFPSVTFTAPESNPTITISKAEDGSACIKPIPEIKEEPMDFSLPFCSFSKDQPITTSVASSSPKHSQIFICDNLANSKPAAPAVEPQKPSVEELLSISDLITLPSSQKIKVTVPQAKITTNTFTHKTQIQIPTSALQTILKNGRLVTKFQQDGQIFSKIKIRTDSQIDQDIQQHMKINPTQMNLPPTPPSSTSSDTEGSNSPRSRASSTGCPNSPVRHPTHIRVQPATNSLDAQLLSSNQRLTQSHGTLTLTEEEKRTLVAEGYSVPSKFPLTKNEEKSLKKIRRKIKNKISAQESRRKKKEYVETLEKRMDDFNKENLDLKRKLDSLESSNRSLLSQLRSLQTLVAGKMPKPNRTVNTQTSSCLMMIVLCFAVFLGGWYPFLSPMRSNDITSITSSGQILPDVHRQSRVLMSIKDDEMAKRCLDDARCYAYDPPHGETPIHDAAMNEPPTDGGSDTYDEPTGGRVTMNDTGDQTSNIIANTMEPRTAADIIASRKVAVQSSKMEVVYESNSAHDVTKKFVAGTQLVTE
uniref:CREB/ATF-a cyclic AMP-responsive element-binding protein n=1 Tax=Phallusia mammillata TaxID=59560 RepID=A0A6F9DAS1_9ASCI|nr:CREB/ATF-a cyclic AMP-responsive element-binding protein [Phallusia mammillata]